MKKVYSLLTMAVIAAMSLTMTSCDGDDYWYDPYGWYNHYDDWGWNNNDWNNDKQLADDSRNAAKMPRTARAFQHGRKPGNVNVSMGFSTVRVDLFYRRGEN